MLRLIFLVLCLLHLPINTMAEIKMPRGYSLLQTDAGEYYVTNKDDEIVIPAKIIKIGWNRKWLAACVENVSIDTDLKRYFYINRKIGGASDTINQENWNYFKGIYPELGNIEYQSLSEDTCPS